MNELNRIEEEKQKGDRNKMFDKGYKIEFILQNLKRYELLEILSRML